MGRKGRREGGRKENASFQKRKTHFLDVMINLLGNDVNPLVGIEPSWSPLRSHLFTLLNWRLSFQNVNLEVNRPHRTTYFAQINECAARGLA